MNYSTFKYEFLTAYTKERIFYIAQTVLAFIGIIWGLLEASSFIFKETSGGENKYIELIRQFCSQHIVAILLIFIIISIFLHRREKRIQHTFRNTDIELTVEFCNDIFEENGALIIAAIDTFDTSISNELVNPNTLHGQMIEKYYSGQLNLLDNEIKQCLLLNGNIPYETDKNLKGKKERYQIGTTVMLRPMDKLIYHTVLTKMTSTKSAELKEEFVDTFLINIWDFIQKHGIYNDELVIPVIGTGKKKLPGSYTNQFVVYRIIESFAHKIKSITFCRKLKICLRDLDYEKYDLEKIEDFLVYIDDYLLIEQRTIKR